MGYLYISPPMERLPELVRLSVRRAGISSRPPRQSPRLLKALQSTRTVFAPVPDIKGEFGPLENRHSFTSSNLAEVASLGLGGEVASNDTDFALPILESFAKPGLTTKESDVAEAIWDAVHDTAGQLRFPAGLDAVALAEAR